MNVSDDCFNLVWLWPPLNARLYVSGQHQPPSNKNGI